jgi:hypothetical protein
MGFEKFMNFLDQRYYGDVVMTVFELIAIITGFLFLKKDKIGVYFLIYLLCDFYIVLNYWYFELSEIISEKKISFFVNIANVLISLIGFLVYYYFFFKIIHNRFVIKLMKILLLIFIVLVGAFLTTEFSFLTNRPAYISDLISSTEFLFLLPPCFIYFYELLKIDSIINLFKRPSFWVVTGIFFNSLVSVPFFLIDRFFFSNHNEYRFLILLLFFNVPLTINFIFLTRAFLCKKTLTI